ncbi:13541_t:CDS:2 [Funneliformis mosseae]|uniref:13541_t:CDS:1 n=1 Tax=Funneliformis mosseae TaxID=27381 RepID=A0A9N9A518_FUNMO|nr:13541_t:CDS:2 [Funneliformis mosseae]
MQQPKTQPPTSVLRSCANISLGIFHFPFLIMTKITQKLLSPVKRNQRRIQNRSPTFVFKIIWTLALLIGEIIIFSYSMRKCSWPEHKNWNTTETRPIHVAIIADPQIIDDYSYGRTGILQRISEIYPDMYMRKNWINLQNIFDPDAIIFLAGNHDIGFGDHVIPEAFYRFRKEFGPLSYMTNIGNHSFIALDTITLSGSNETLKKDAKELIQRLENDTTNSLPRILLTHVPLYRPPNTDCGTLRQQSRYIKQGAGYQYQNLIVESLTNYILNNIKPMLIFSGDDHDYCEILHDELDGIPEITVNSFSFAMGREERGQVANKPNERVRE